MRFGGRFQEISLALHFKQGSDLRIIGKAEPCQHMRGSRQIVERAELVLKLLQCPDEPLVPPPLPLAREQVGLEIACVTQFLGGLADLVSRFVVKVFEIAATLLNHAAEAIERPGRKLTGGQFTDGLGVTPQPPIDNGDPF